MINFFGFLSLLQQGRAQARLSNYLPLGSFRLWGAVNCGGVRIFWQDHKSYRKEKTYRVFLVHYHLLYYKKWQTDSVWLYKSVRNTVLEYQNSYEVKEPYASVSKHRLSSNTIISQQVLIDTSTNNIFTLVHQWPLIHFQLWNVKFINIFLRTLKTDLKILVLVRKVKHSKQE